MHQCLPRDMQFTSAEDEGKIGYKEDGENKVVYYNDKGTFRSSCALIISSTQYLTKILVSMISTMRAVLKIKGLESQQFIKSGEVQDISPLDSEMERSINK